MSAQVGIIGGSGLYDMAELTDREQVTITTPFGDPSGPYVLATLRGRRVAFLARHGAGHRLMPGELNFRANIFGFKRLGVERILSASAVGSLREDYKPLDIVVPDQFFDRTAGRVSTFFGGGIAAHVGFAHPVCGELAALADRIRSTPSSLNPKMFARKFSSPGRMRWPVPCRARNATRRPRRVAVTYGPDGGPNGVSSVTSCRSASPSMS